jgi:hypothetical protein
MRSLRARLDRLEKRLAQRGERDYQHELELFGRSVGGDKQAFEEWTAIVINDRSEEPPRRFSARLIRAWRPTSLIKKKTSVKAQIS